MLILFFPNIDIDEDKCKKALTEELYSVEKVADLVKKGISFRDAYNRVGKHY
jgi:argininosuccinate lyase